MVAGVDLEGGVRVAVGATVVGHAEWDPALTSADLLDLIIF